MVMFKTSERCKEILKGMEGLSLVVYDDQTGRKTNNFVRGSTIGYGHLITTQKEFLYYIDGINENEANELLSKDLKPFEDNINRVNKKSDLTQNEFDALLLLSFNIGIGNFNSSSVLKINNGLPNNYGNNIERAFAAWNKSQGKIMNGLIKRRKLESDMYIKGEYRFFR